jgi:hypothetical protein
MNAALALVLGLVVAGAVLTASRATSPAAPERAAWTVDRRMPIRLVTASAAAIAALLATRWVLAAVVAFTVVLFRGRVFSSKRAGAERARLQAIATWLESLRDSLGADASLQTVLFKVAEAPPAPIAAELVQFTRRCRHGMALSESLWRLGDDLAHPTADLAIATMIQSIELSGARLRRQLGELATTARHELSMRERVDRIRSRFEGAAKAMVGIGLAIVAYLSFASGLLGYYRTPVGQLVLAIPVSLWVVTFWWLRRLSAYELPTRTITRRPHVVAA